MKQSRNYIKQGRGIKHQANNAGSAYPERANDNEVSITEGIDHLRNVVFINQNQNASYGVNDLLNAQQYYGNKLIQQMASQEADLTGGNEKKIEIDMHSGKISTLDDKQRMKYENAFKKDLSTVQIHTGTQADDINQALGGRAFTAGKHIFLRENRLNTNQNRKIMIHELTHVLQSSDENESCLTYDADRNSGYEEEARNNAVEYTNKAGDMSVTGAQVSGQLMLSGEEEALSESSGELDVLMEQATGSHSGDVLEDILEETAWSGINGEEAAEINGYLRGGQRDRAVQRVWEILLTSLSSDAESRITVNYTTDIGTYNGESIMNPGGADAMALAYVRRKAECSSAAEVEAHRGLHSADEINVVIQVGPTVFATALEEQLSTLHSALMHEYTHARQYFERGITGQINFRAPVGDMEFLNESYSGTAERHRVEGQDEIEAYASEIEHADETGLSNAYSIQHAINGLWDNYANYFSGVSGNPDRDTAQRVHNAIEQGRQMFWDYLHSLRGELFTRVRSPEDFLADCPAHYDTSIIQGFVTGYEHIAFTGGGD